MRRNRTTGREELPKIPPLLNVVKRLVLARCDKAAATAGADLRQDLLREVSSLHAHDREGLIVRISSGEDRRRLALERGVQKYIDLLRDIQKSVLLEDLPRLAESVRSITPSGLASWFFEIWPRDVSSHFQWIQDALCNMDQIFEERIDRMWVRPTVGKYAGEVREFTFEIGRDLVRKGDGERVDRDSWKVDVSAVATYVERRLKELRDPIFDEAVLKSASSQAWGIGDLGEDAKKKVGRRPDKIREYRWSIIRAVWRENPKLRGAAFWSKVHQRGGRPNLSWCAKGCPPTFPDAWDSGPYWRKKLNQEKSVACASSH